VISQKLPWLVNHAKRTLAIIRQNVVFSLGVKALFIGLTFAGFAALWGPSPPTPALRSLWL
jgi:Cd2+/Zn2+-exporting ATPase